MSGVVEVGRGREALLADADWGATFREIESIAGGRLCAAERRAVLDDYIDRLAEIHRLDAGLFEKLGIPRPRTAAERSLADLPRWESLYRRCKNQPEPVIELALGWLRENVPAHRKRVSCLV